MLLTNNNESRFLLFLPRCLQYYILATTSIVL